MFKAIIFSLIFLSQSGFAPGKTNEIYDFKILKQTQDFVLFEISYYYAGDRGNNAKLTAWPKPPGFWGSSIIPLVVGEHTTQLSSIEERAPEKLPVLSNLVSGTAGETEITSFTQTTKSARKNYFQNRVFLQPR